MSKQIKISPNQSIAPIIIHKLTTKLNRLFYYSNSTNVHREASAKGISKIHKNIMKHSLQLDASKALTPYRLKMMESHTKCPQTSKHMLPKDKFKRRVRLQQ